MLTAIIKLFFNFSTVGGALTTTTSENRESCPSPPVAGAGSRSESGSATPTRLGMDDDSMNDPTTLPINDLNMSFSPSMSPAETVQVVPR